MSSDEEVPMDTQDRIEREIRIEAPAARVWQLVARPGWWIGDGDRSGHTVTTDGDLIVVHDPRYGKFPMYRVASDEPRYLAYRCSAVIDEPPRDGAATLVEFVLTEVGGGTVLRVVESGFGALDGTPAQRREAFEGNTDGWRQQLDIAKRDVESA
ncbi:hypothetical protein A4U64_11845 [Rhodococcus sp. WB1]|nr:hypothetical protein AAT18_12955 [Rhodococcus aetherivorans]ANZ25290.1 hypothetical protein A4U64_11845 [Rhodococcus sp. WB1]